MDTKIIQAAEKYRDDMTKFLRDMVAIPSESCQEKEVIQRIKQEMEKVGFDEVRIDKMGNILGRVGHGKHVIAMDAHIDTVGIADPKLWSCDPYKASWKTASFTDAALPIRKAAWLPWFTRVKLSRIWGWKTIIPCG